MQVASARSTTGQSKRRASKPSLSTLSDPESHDAASGLEALGPDAAEITRRDPPIETKLRDFLAVRGRDGKPCKVCGTTIRAVRVGDGDACFCPTCQPTGRKLVVVFCKLPKG